MYNGLILHHLQGFFLEIYSITHSNYTNLQVMVYKKSPSSVYILPQEFELSINLQNTPHLYFSIKSFYQVDNEDEI